MKTFETYSGPIRLDDDGNIIGKIDRAFRQVQRNVEKVADMATKSKNAQIAREQQTLEKLQEQNRELLRRKARQDLEQKARDDLERYGMAQDDTGEVVLRPIEIEDIARFDPEKAEALRKAGVKSGEAPARRDEVLRPEDFGLTEEDMKRAQQLPQGEDDEDE